ncbi:MAG: tRNA pseudouridine(38-40) synthase TruA [Lachnospiraceae bacterium]|nr:tRNA pseudouridine(38-40) synthase TruA [Robinsoniella sp.]MDY3765492.1 tRNA pseudouridine(38-40) synthase TruA [Lachnospiraceae bacterium]
MNYGLWIQYEGTRFEGWQKQNRTDQTIQGKIEAVLSRMFDETIEIQGAGRTDAGVHALGQVANFHTEKQVSCEWIKQEMNRYLPVDIGILEVRQMPERFHSRLCAKEKVYRYRIGLEKEKNVFEYRWLYGIYDPLDLEAMRAAAQLLSGTHDYRSFCSNRRMKKSTVRTVSSIEIEEKGEELWLTFTGDGFLYHMVRILVGTLVEVGRGERTVQSMVQILEGKDRQLAGKTAPAQGLTMVEVRYPENF